jgi:rod shape-determining protein MreC
MPPRPANIASLPGSSDTDSPRRRRWGWLALFLALSIVITTVWFREGQRGPIHLARIGVQTVVTPIGRAGHWITTPLRSFAFWVSDLGVTRSQLTELRQQNEDLRARVGAMEEANLENGRLRALINVAAQNELGGVGATVIGLPENTYDRVLVLNVGTADGVALTNPVMTARGLLGQVIEAGRNFCRVRLITDQKSGVAALIQRDRQPGVVRGSLTGELTLDFVANEVEVQPGDTVLTSGLGGIFPKGLVIGEVTDVSDDVNALYKSIVLHSANDINDLEDVLVLTNTAPALERLDSLDTTSATSSTGSGSAGSGSTTESGAGQ